MRKIFPVVAFLVLVAAAFAQDTVKKGMAQLEGEWSMISGQANGAAMPEEMVKSGKRVAKDGETTITFGGRVYIKAKVSIDPAMKPKAIDYRLTEGPQRGRTNWRVTSGTGTRSSFASPPQARTARLRSRPRRAARGP